MALLLDAFTNLKKPSRPAVWMMRQAGRYMPEYKAIRGQTPFMTLCQTPDLAVEVSLQPWRAFGMDAVIMFSDILVPVHAMGMHVTFEEKRGPVIAQPLRHGDNLSQLKRPDPTMDTGYVMTILQRLKQVIQAEESNPDGTALIGFAGAPWTMASYMIEGGTSKHHLHLKGWMFENPATLHQLLQHTTDVVIEYLLAQVAAGAQAVQLFDTWAGLLTQAQYQTFALPYQQQIFNALNTAHPTVPTLLYVQHSGHLLELMAQTGTKGISLDWLTPVAEARKRVGANLLIQGNLDPVALFTNPTVLTPAVQTIVDQGMPHEGGYIFNLGHGILPQTPVANVRHVVNTVKACQYAHA
jgi:uroporphyrinogen decarboxylase